MNFFKRLLPYKFKRKFKDHLGVPSLHWSLLNLKRIGFNPEFVVDIGAYHGEWTSSFLEVFPNTTVLMIEAQRSKEMHLHKICHLNPKCRYQIELLSSEKGKSIAFYENETASHVVNYDEDNTVRIDSDTIDCVMEKEMLYPDFIKLDVQGHELEILKGGETTLKNAEFCLLEVSLLELSGEPSFATVIDFMDQRGFQAYDICQFMRRPFDHALYQVDLLFINKRSDFIKNRRWS